MSHLNEKHCSSFKQKVNYRWPSTEFGGTEDCGEWLRIQKDFIWNEENILKLVVMMVK